MTSTGERADGAVRSKHDPSHVTGAWSRTLGLAALVVLVALGSWELHWRSRGATPSISDVRASWSVARARVRSDSVVLIGTSKMQSALVPQVLGEALGTQPAIQLALIGRSPLPVLEQLADDPTFAGLVIVDVAARIFFDGSGDRERSAEAVLAADHAYRTSPSNWVNARLGLVVENLLVLRLPNFSLRRLLLNWQTGARFELPFARVRLDRFRELDFSNVNLEGRKVTQVVVLKTRGRPATQEELEAMAARVRSAAERIRERGGDVVLTVLPLSGAAMEAEEERFPRSDYWDPLVHQAGVPAIYFADHDGLSRFEARDGIHLEHWEASPFTEAFASALRQRLPSRF